MKRRDFVKNSVKGTIGAGVISSATFANAQPLPNEHYKPRNPRSPLRLSGSMNKSVLIIGGGLAGLSAALELSERGFQVVVRESDTVFGGKLATRDIVTDQGPFRVEHGLHMWFDNYHTFKDLRSRLKLNENFRKYGKVNFIFKDYKPEALESSPAIYPLNMVNLLFRSPNFNPLEAAGIMGMIGDVLLYRHRTIYDRLDHITFDEWAKKKKISKKFYDIFMEPASSVTLNDPSKVSAAEMIHFMHYYFTGQPRAMNREVTTVDHGTAVIDPWVRQLEANGVEMRLSDPVGGLVVKSNRVVGTTDSSERFDWVIMCSDVAGSKKILSKSDAVDAAGNDKLQRLNSRFDSMKVAPHYKVLRVWFDQKPDSGKPDIIETPQHTPINLVAQFHLLEEESREWSDATGGSILEFHLYNTPEWQGEPDEMIWGLIQEEALKIFPELLDAKVLATTVGSYDNFTSYEVGQGTIAPPVDFGLTLGFENLSLAGDWVHLNFPAALMEKAVVSGRMAANECMLSNNVRESSYVMTAGMGPGLI